MLRIALVGTLLAASVSWCLAAEAGPANPKGVVELFTSQSCASCPPADAVLGRLVREGQVVALSYHVDYWNYLGWHDTFSAKRFTERQYAYARTLGRENVYTPQAVIDGRDHAVGSNEGAIERKVAALAGRGGRLPVSLSASRAGDTLTIRVGAGAGSANVVLVTFDGQNRVSIRDGENRGRSVTYWHTVRAIQTIGMWEGKPVKFEVPASMTGDGPGGGCAILLQHMRNDTTPGRILGATVAGAR